MRARKAERHQARTKIRIASLATLPLTRMTCDGISVKAKTATTVIAIIANKIKSANRIFLIFIRLKIGALTLDVFRRETTR